MKWHAIHASLDLRVCEALRDELCVELVDGGDVVVCGVRMDGGGAGMFIRVLESLYTYVNAFSYTLELY